MKDYKAVFCDIDGTLLTDDKKLLPEVQEKIKQFTKDKNIPFILVSGRLPAGIYPIQEALELEEPIIAFGGGLVNDKDRNTIFEQGLDKKTAQEIEQLANELKPDAALNFYNGINWYTSDLQHPIEQWEARSIGVTPVETTVEEVIGDQDIVNKCMFAGTEEAIEELLPIYKEKFPDLHVVKSLPILLEIVDGNVQKSRAIELLCKEMGIQPDEIVAIGDNFNDQDMLELAGLPVVMANAPEELKQLEKAVIVRDNNSGGVAEAIDKIFYDK